MNRLKLKFLKPVLALALLSYGAVDTAKAQCTAPASVSGTATRCDSATVSWPAVAGVTYIYAVNQDPSHTGAGVSTSATTARQGGLYPNTTYYVHVRSNCGTGTSAWTRSSFTTPTCPPGVCLAPNTTTVGTITNNSISYSWNSFPGALGYEYVVDQIATDPVGSGTFTTATSITASGLTSGNLYYFHVRTKCSANSFSPWRNATVNRTMGADPNCATPGPITSSFLRCDSIVFNWPVVTGHTGYLYTFAPIPNVPAATSIGLTNSVSRRNLNASTLYYASVVANCGMGRSNTRVDSFLTPACNGSTNCLAPASATITSVTATSMSASWSAVTGAIGYEVMLTSTPATPTTNGNARTTTSASATGLTPNRTYYFHVRTQCATNRFSPWRTPITLSTTPTSVANNLSEPEQSISIYPNPASHTLYIRFDKYVTGTGNLQLFNITGQLVKDQPIDPTKMLQTIATDDIANGTYFMHISTTEGRLMHKISIQN